MLNLDTEIDPPDTPRLAWRQFEDRGLQVHFISVPDGGRFRVYYAEDIEKKFEKMAESGGFNAIFQGKEDGRNPKFWRFERDAVVYVW